MSDILGNSNETQILINNVQTIGLLDTGSCVSTISKAFYENNFKDLELMPLDNILKLECADGQSLPYFGYIQVDLQSVDFPTKHVQSSILLVVPDTEYNSNVPLLLGTNVLTEFLNSCKYELGDNFLHHAELHTPWYLAFRCLVVRDKELKKNKHRLAVIKSAERENITVPANSTVTIKGVTSKELDYRPTCAMLVQTEKSVLPDDFDITPAVVHYNYKKNGIIEVQVSNVTMSTYTIPPKAVLCELQPVAVDLDYHVAESVETQESIFDQVSVETLGLSESEVEKLKNLLLQHKDIFSTGDTDIGHCTFVKHKINLTDEIPFKQRHRRIPPAMIDEVRAHLEQLAASGIIRESHSPWASNIVLVKKRDGSIRMCVDYRQLNKRTIRDSYALPRIEEILDTLSGSKYFTVLDMKSGYHQIEVFEEHKCRTAFTVGPLGFWEFNRLPFGLSNAPATYQRLMEQCLGDLNMKICAIYLDDLIIFSNSLEQHLERLDTVLRRLKECNLKLSPNKCKFLQTKVRYVGHIVSENGVEACPEKLEKVRNWPTPKNGEQVRQFTAFAGYYRRFVKDFSKIAKPLTDLHPNTCFKDGRKVTSSKQFQWGIEQQEAFEKLKLALTSPPVLGYADYKSPFEVHTDASQKGLGAVLYQQQEGKLRVISYASRGLKKSEKNYPAAKLEFLALKWAVSEKYHDYLYGSKFTVVTDNNPLTYVLSKAKLDSTGHRWLSSLASYDFDIVYRPGKSNIDADILSKHPSIEAQHMPSESVRAVCGSLVSPVSPIVPISVDIVGITEFPGQPMAQVDMRELRKQQNADSCVGFWLRAVRDKRKPCRSEIHSREDSCMLKSFENFKVVRGLLYRDVISEGELKHQLVLPSGYIEQVLTGLHNEMGHPSKDRTLSLIRDRFFWPGMTSDTETWVSNCERCIKRKSKTDVRAPLVNITTTFPLELVCLDYLTLEPSKGNISNVLVITDHFTRFAVAIPTRNQTAQTTAEVLYKEFIVRYGIPARLHSDQGANFESALIKQLCEIMGISKSRTSVYHAAGNGMTERFNRTLISMLGTLENDKKQNWKQYIPPLVQAYNCIRHESTGYSPYMLFFGREPKLPLDVTFGLDNNAKNDVSYTEYISNLQSKMKEAFDIVNKNANKSRDKQKSYYDLKARAAQLIVGDRVLVKILAHDGKHKLSDKWSDEVYIITEHPNSEIPVYKVKREDGGGNEKTLHRNHLLHLGNRMHDKVYFSDKLSTQSNETSMSKSPLASDAKTEIISGSDKPKPAPRKKKSDSFDIIALNDSNRVEEEEDVSGTVVVTTTTRKSPIKDTAEVVASADDTAKNAEYIDTVEEEDVLRDHGDAYDSDHQAISDVKDVSVSSEDNTSVERNAENKSLMVENTTVDVSVDNNQSRVKERSNLTSENPIRRSSRVRKKPKWQESGDYCMSLSKQSLMLQSLISSDGISKLDPKVISAIVKGIGDSV